ncbi:Mitochondrial intermediate peptidase [Erysiphe necator]|uniref:Mitochondrial intermediate peptidase n=1 Tax=Uncinula necator TaxID=52586 RepID=A0A0B1P9I3_UNCNE|nr:Mitochondrial intermediate peptidase [Erysiphe necator]KHJ35332.1 putative mitochondrial intermediate peptidase [Erysiphe necator]
MFRLAPSRRWTCTKCLCIRSQLRRKHELALNNSEIHPRKSGLLDHSDPGVKNDDATLRDVFDSVGFWKQFSQSSKNMPNHGLFQNRYLTKIEGFEEFARVSLEKAQRIVDRVLMASTEEQYSNIVKDLDRLSDLLCRVIDLSDFVRSTHPDPKVQDAASKAFAIMYEYMNVLNTTTGLARQLDIAIKFASKSKIWDDQETLVALILKKDFEKSAINLPEHERKRFVSLSQEISETGQDFVVKMAPEKENLCFPSNKLLGMDPTLVKRFMSWGQVTLPTVGTIASTALKNVQDEETRMMIFLASRTSCPKTIEKLHKLLKLRVELAKLTNFKTYAHMTLEDKMAKSPEMVIAFLKSLSKKNKSLVVSELAQLLKVKKLVINKNDVSLQPWDKDFYIYRIQSTIRTKFKRADFLSSFFSLGRVMQGLSRLFHRLFGIRLVPCETLPGEIWHPDVRRLNVISETEGHVAVLYCDLFSRSGKSSNPAHFTLRCSRLIRDTEIEEAIASRNPLFESPIIEVNDGMSSSVTPSGLMQLPTIALICDFPQNTTSQPSLLSFSELTTLFHEMGHAIHSILGRTIFQNVSGTRCATDFAELPSVLMEHFVMDPHVIELFAEHYETGAKLDYAMIKEKLLVNSQFEGYETEIQIILALLDQAYHSELPLDSNFDSSKVYLNIQKEYGVLPSDPEGTSWQGFFGHLFGYGSMYYSYLFDKVLAKKIWSTVFENGKASISRSHGERYQREVLKWGGARDPWKCLSNVLEDERLEHGGEKAMGIVGSWGIEDKRKI